MRKHDKRVKELLGGKPEQEDYSAVSSGGPQCIECKDTGVAYYAGVGDDTCRNCGGSVWAALREKENKEAVDHPAHYNAGKYEVIDVIEDWNLDFHLGNVVKYVARAPHKSNERQDLEKALWYLQRRLQNIGE